MNWKEVNTLVEPAARWRDDMQPDVNVSQAISLKRIADALDKLIVQHEHPPMLVSSIPEAMGVDPALLAELVRRTQSDGPIVVRDPTKPWQCQCDMVNAADAVVCERCQGERILSERKAL